MTCHLFLPSSDKVTVLKASVWAPSCPHKHMWASLSRDNLDGTTTCKVHWALWVQTLPGKLTFRCQLTQKLKGRALTEHSWDGEVHTVQRVRRLPGVQKLLSLTPAALILDNNWHIFFLNNSFYWVCADHWADSAGFRSVLELILEF